MDKRIKISPKIKRFCREYVKDHCGAKAAIRAGYSTKTATEQASRMLRKVNVQELIRKYEDKLLNELEIDSKEILREYKKIGFSNIKDFLKFDENGVVFNNSEDVDGSIISEVSSEEIITETGEENPIRTKRVKFKLKLHDKEKALDALARHKNLFKEDNESQKEPIKIKIEYVKPSDK